MYTKYTMYCSLKFVCSWYTQAILVYNYGDQIRGKSGAVF